MSFDRKYIATAANGARITVREAGAGEDVLLFHCSAGSGKQWDGLTDLLGNQFHSVAPDLMGYGGSERWSGQRPPDARRAGPDHVGHPSGLHPT
ncbi:MAG: hypothetical protein KAT39_11960, partial [Alphaproteobacteria bacterium]|nr:hypothetical protein [Alphaproteobacteria bacterium]